MATDFQRQPRKKYCQLCKDDVKFIDYKDVVSRRFTLEQANEGYELLAHGGIQGRGVVDMSL